MANSFLTKLELHNKLLMDSIPQTLIARNFERVCKIDTLGIAIIIGLVCYAVYQIIYYRYFHALKDFPGPFWWSVSRIPLAWNNYWGIEIQAELEFIKKYGKIVRISPTLLLVSTASTLPDIYHRTAWKTPHYTLCTFGPEPTVFHMLSHADYASRAKTVAGIYSSRARMPSTEESMDNHLVAWTRKLGSIMPARSPSLQKKGFDIAPWIQYLTMDVIIELAFGKEQSLGFVENGEDVFDLCGSFKYGLPIYGIVCRMYPFFNWLDTTLFGRFLDWYMFRFDDQIGPLARFVHRVLNQRFKVERDGQKVKENDMLQSYIDARTPEGTPLSEITLRGEVKIVLIAGADNTTAAICTSLFHILKSPNALRQVLEELEVAKASCLISRIPQHSEILQHCPYYVACVKESLRLNPSLPSFLPRYSSFDAEHPLVLHGRTIPPGTEVASNPWITHRDQEIYGIDAEEWIPNRWLDPKKAKILEKYSFTFGYGSRICLGRQLGMMSALKVPLTFLNAFRASLADDGLAHPRLSIRADFSYWENLRVSIEDKERNRN